MAEISTSIDEADDAIAAYLAASRIALESSLRLHEGWRRHFEEGAERPPPNWIEQVAAEQVASDLALGRARVAAEVPIPVPVPPPSEGQAPSAQPTARIKRRRHGENTFLSKIGKPGQGLLRAVLLGGLIVSVLVATGAGISLAFEVAGGLHLIDDTVQLPVGNQLVIFVLATAVAFGVRAALTAVERSLYGSKGVQPKGFTL